VLERILVLIFNGEAWQYQVRATIALDLKP
jgi:hypothetical protein